jgi:hypothetical protein
MRFLSLLTQCHYLPNPSLASLIHFQRIANPISSHPPLPRQCRPCRHHWCFPSIDPWIHISGQSSFRCAMPRFQVRSHPHYPMRLFHSLYFTIAIITIPSSSPSSSSASAKADVCIGVPVGIFAILSSALTKQTKRKRL